MVLLRRAIALLLIFGTALTSLPLHAGMLPASGERQRIAAALERAEVRDELAARGVSLADAQARVAALTDAEAADLAARLDSAPAGGADILAVALVVFLVLLLTDILGYTKVFPFTRPARN